MGPYITFVVIVFVAYLIYYGIQISGDLIKQNKLSQDKRNYDVIPVEGMLDQDKPKVVVEGEGGKVVVAHEQTNSVETNNTNTEQKEESAEKTETPVVPPIPQETPQKKEKKTAAQIKADTESTMEAVYPQFLETGLVAEQVSAYASEIEYKPAA